jgi:hypothetical protein
MDIILPSYESTDRTVLDLNTGSDSEPIFIESENNNTTPNGNDIHVIDECPIPKLPPDNNAIPDNILPLIIIAQDKT